MSKLILPFLAVVLLVAVAAVKIFFWGIAILVIGWRTRSIGKTLLGAGLMAAPVLLLAILPWGEGAERASLLGMALRRIGQWWADG